jgi:hypothetical protein
VWSSSLLYCSLVYNRKGGCCILNAPGWIGVSKHSIYLGKEEISTNQYLITNNNTKKKENNRN